VEWAEEDEADAEANGSASKESKEAVELKGGVGSDSSGPLFKAPAAAEAEESE
jgi:hypothetical protein